MAKRVIAAPVAIFILTAALWPQETKRTIEDGIEVIWNALEPSRHAGKQSTIFLEEELRVDLARTDLVVAGLAEPAGMDVDAEDNIYVFTQRSNANFIFKLEKTGKLLTSFGRTGQGPGELQFPTFAMISPKEELFVVDQRRRKLVVFSKAGTLIRERTIEFANSIVWPLPKDRFLTSFYEYTPEAEYSISHLFIIGEDWQKVAELNPIRSVNMARASRIDGVAARPILAVTPQYIFLGNTERDYEIWVYDHEGRLLKKIRKDYKQVEVDEGFKDKVRERFSRAPEILQKLYFSKTFPPFQAGFADENGYLFVMTYEKGKDAAEFLYDVFNPDGVFVARTALPNYGRHGVSETALFAIARRGRVYCFREKESGFKEIIVYKLNRE